MAHRDDVRALPEPYLRLHEALARHLPGERLVTDPLRRLALGTDASFYRLTPRLVVEVRTVEEVRRVLAEAARLGTPVTFRAAGTSLSGQAVTDSVLVRVTGGWRGMRVLDGGARIALEPGVIGADANAVLAPLGRKLGPDPASIGACMVGGIAANNASGMCCGTAQNSYRTVASMRLVLADGTELDTGDPASRAAFHAAHPELVAGLRAIRAEIEADPALRRRIVEKFRIKNTTGYALNAFVDFEDPVDVLLHLMIGSEGTLGFIAEVTYHTVPEHAHKASALALFAGVGDAARATMLLQGGPVAAVELMDRASLRSVEAKPGMPPELAGLPDGAAALLIETRAATPAELGPQVDALLARMAPVPVLAPVRFTAVKAEYERLWDVRRGLFPAVGAARPIGTTVVIEDVAFPIRHLADATVELQGLLAAHGYDGIIFGHALDGNLHFVFTPDFGAEGEVERYARFMDDVCTMVARKYDGSLKGEHGTGRNVAPFVELEWGAKATGLMRRVKRLLDPGGLLNPGVLLNDDPHAHLRHLKALPHAHPILDRCIECGFCEPRCPSRDLTLTPRQRIVAQREIARLRVTGEDPAARERLERDYVYLGEETCAVDGLCATACPVGIDTGEHTKWLRAQAHGDGGGAADLAADRFAAVAAGARAGLRLASAAHAVLGTAALSGLTRGLHRLSAGRLPVWNEATPRAARAPRLDGTRRGGDRVVYFPSCVSRTMGPARGDAEGVEVHAAMLSLLGKAGFDVAFPAGMEGLCCGMPFESKGWPAQADRKSRELEAALLEASEGGRHPVVFDTSPCVYRMRKAAGGRIAIHDPVEFIQRLVLPRVSLTRVPGPVAVHVPCSAVKLGLGPAFRAVAEACAEQVVIPREVGCCGFAGDRGFTHPELNASALAPLAAALPAGCAAGFSSSRTCEIGLSLHAGVPYRPLAWLVDRCASPRAARDPEPSVPPDAPTVKEIAR
ncbi:FAD-binding and (Fe-S)-binding domain-containing protein [Anaeromyxobacter sp. PSR-1]|uniref:FAD-binding and (Fe-S)-binding domain-containing protein n=1 Tax=Anaeromyxobacter sp. PSR-1 TaxID=1300915 RepID=UPI0005E4C6A2|nr:FAD-binding and (Fe-S)-binding domain-containing protein [Anaeromyxobacter sp. PSR-1]GAO03232.1 glycolate oxidase subunit GlcD [Anaeromyxobacter sp. PSR-1]